MTEQEYAHFAQEQAIWWLIGRCEDQMVRAWLVSERQLLMKLDGPITSSGTPFERKPE